MPAQANYAKAFLAEQMQPGSGQRPPLPPILYEAVRKPGVVGNVENGASDLAYEPRTPCCKDARGGVL